MPDRVDRPDPTLIQREPMRLFLRTIGTLLLAVALILIILDGTRSLGENRLLIASLAETWNLLHAPSLGGFQEFLGSRLFGPLLRRQGGGLQLVQLGAGVLQIAEAI